MTSSRFVRLVGPIVLVLLLASTTASAQAEGRTPEELSLTMTGTPTTFTNTADFMAAENVFDLGEGEALTVAVECPPPTGCAAEAPQLHYGWISAPLFNETGVPGTFVGTYEVILTLSGNQGTQPLAAGDVTFQVEPGYFQPGQNMHVHGAAAGSTTVSPQAPSPVPQVPGLPGGVLPGTVVVPLDFNGTNAMQVPAEGRLALRLTISLDASGSADFTLSTGGALPTLQYYFGNPDDPDTDGDGVPDPLDVDTDGDSATDEAELQVGADPADPNVTPQSDSSICPGFTYQEVFDETGNPNTCPETGGFPWLILLVIILVVVLLLGGGFAALTVVGRKVRLSVSHDGFQAIEQGQTAQYELELVATGKKEEIVPVELALKGVPEDWSATLEPSHLTLYAGEEPEPQQAVLRLTPPADEQFEAEAQVTVTATPTDEEGKTSALNPGSSVKTKTIVNIGITDPEGGKKKRKAKAPAEDAAEEGAAEDADAAEAKPKRGGFLKRKKKEDADAEEPDAEDATPAAAAAAAAAPAGKPQIGMGKMRHEPEDFSEGDAVTTTVTVRNKGDAAVEGLNLNLFVNDEKADSQSVDLAPGESRDVTFNWTAQPDENRVRIKGGLKGA